MRDEIEQEKEMATIINGKVYHGNNVTIRNGTVFIDGRRQDQEVNGVVEVKVTEGDLVNIDTDASVTCMTVKGNVSAGGSVSCRDIGGSVNAGGSVSASGRAGGAINAGGSVMVG